jgi:uncharacterized protein YjiS (DUF1127 family)
MSGKIFFKARSETRNSASWKIAARLVATPVIDVARSTLRAIVNRRSVNMLDEMDDRMLRDIGLTRGDVDSALAQPWHKDPTRMLARGIEKRVRRLPFACSHGEAGGRATPQRCDQGSRGLRLTASEILEHRRDFR